MLFSWFKSRRRRKLLAEPFPPRWSALLDNDLFFSPFLWPEQRARLEERMKIFIPEKEWIGCRGLEVSERMKVLVATQASLLVLNKGLDALDMVSTVLLYPGSYRREERGRGPDGVVTEEAFIGEAWYRGPVVLSWEDILADLEHPEDGMNVVFHEFAHKLDMTNGASDGTPALDERAAYDRWAEVMKAAFDDHVSRDKRGEKTFFDPYGAESESEFFAVAVEAFFTQGRRMRRKHAAMYGLFKDYFGLDPAEWGEQRDG
jgi:MtfA peptidase